MDFEAEIRRRVTLLEKEVEGEKTVSRHILNKVNETENLLLDLSKRAANIEDRLALLRADMPSIIAEVVGALLREEREPRSNNSGLAEPNPACFAKFLPASEPGLPMTPELSLFYFNNWHDGF